MLKNKKRRIIIDESKEISKVAWEFLQRDILKRAITPLFFRSYDRIQKLYGFKKIKINYIKTDSFYSA